MKCKFSFVPCTREIKKDQEVQRAGWSLERIANPLTGQPSPSLETSLLINGHAARKRPRG